MRSKPVDPKRGPRSFMEAELRRVGVHLTDPNRLILHCMWCGWGWSPNIPGGGRRLRRGYWICPHFGCNRPEGVSYAS